MAEETGVRGMQSWWKLSREVAGKTGARLEGLADRVAYPKALSSWHTAEAELNRWEQDRREMEKLEGQGLSELNKKTILKRLLGTLGKELGRELERSKELKPFDKAIEYVYEQIPLLRASAPKNTRGKNDMEVDAMEAEQKETDEKEPADEELDTLKGGGKGGSGSKYFDGACNWCGIWGHQNKDCRKATEYLAKSGKGKGDGKGEQKGEQKGDGGKGGWQVKGGHFRPWQDRGGKGKGSKGSGKGKGGGKNLYSMHIDGDWGNDWFGGWENQGYSNNGRFFMLTEEDDSENDEELCMMCDGDDDTADREEVFKKSIYGQLGKGSFMSAVALRNYEFPTSESKLLPKSKSLRKVANQGKLLSRDKSKGNEREYRDAEREFQL